MARGIMTRKDVELINKKMKEELEGKSARIGGIYFCPCDDNDCNCRKPKPGMLLKAAEDFKVDLKKSYMIGDALTDIEAGKRAGCTTIFINSSQENNFYLSNETKIYPDHTVYNLLEATKIIEEISRKRL